MMQLWTDFLTIFFPRQCRACRGPLLKGEEIICTQCILDLPRTNHHLHLINPLSRKMLGRIDLAYAMAFLKFQKSGIVQHLLHQLKYNHRPEIGRMLGRLYGNDLWKAGYGDAWDMIIPVPLHHSRQRRRGYNQSAMFAEGLSDALHIPWSENISVRKVKTATQTRRSKLERWENVRDVFAVAEGVNLTHQRILLVDDVITTGATLESCAQRLMERGSPKMSIACIAEAQ